jgi:hypothetical protein
VVLHAVAAPRLLVAPKISVRQSTTKDMETIQNRNNRHCKYGNTMMDTAELSQSTQYTDSEGVSVTEEEARLNRELRTLRSMRMSFSALLTLLEAVRDDLLLHGNHCERLTIASENCRLALAKVKETRIESMTMSTEAHTNKNMLKHAS